MPPKKKVGGKSKGDDEEHLTRIAIVNAEKCKPKKCNQECKKSCPVVKLGKLCIEVTPKSKLAFISEPLCIGTSIMERYFVMCRVDTFFSLVVCVIQVVVFVLRNARLKLLTLLTYPKTWKRTRRIVTDPTRSSCIVCPCPVRDRFWDWSARTVSASRRHSKFWPAK